MKRPYPDIEKILKAQYLQKLRFIRRFVKYWGTEVVIDPSTGENVEVLRDKVFFYKTWRQDDNFEKLARLLGAWDELKDPDMDGVERAWLYLNKDNQDLSGLSGNILAHNFNLAQWAKEEAVPEAYKNTFTMTIGGTYDEYWTTKRFSWRSEYIKPTFTAPLTDQEAVKAELLSVYSDWFETYPINTFYTAGTTSSEVTSKDQDPYRDALASYILLSNDVPFTIKDVRNGLVETSYKYHYYYAYEQEIPQSGYKTSKVLKPGYEIEIEIPYYTFTETTDIVTLLNSHVTEVDSIGTNQDAINYISGLGINKKRIVDSIAGIRSYVTEDVFGEETTNYTPHSNSIHNEFWVAVENIGIPYSNYVLKADVLLTNNYLTLDERRELISQLIDTGYKKKSSSKWGGLLAFVVFVVVVALSYGTYGLTGGIVLGALAVSVTALALQELGYTEYAAAFGKFSQQIQPLVQIASIISIFNALMNLYNAVAESARQAAIQAATEVALEQGMGAVSKTVFEEFVTTYAQDLLEEQFFTMVWEGVKDQFQNLLIQKTTNLSLENAMRMANYVFDYYQKNKLGELRDDIEQVRNDLEKYATEQTQVSNILLDFNRLIFRPLKADWSIYADKFDRPYEWWSTPYHTGNIQANTVDGLWLSDRKNGIMRKNVI